ncbi:hypothetical protein Ocin01_02120 [Orchesella cincta]|uniref:Uncharacterized protein n=1 Tax=Orchesella cincta TaxID=48709 RepID=A0A1D2NH38_ORCCI|nr:hypothetical protein Ocin01_02120 [Orchesella cincta]
MGMLGENCPPPPPPPYAKLKKKSKPDDVFFFDYITVMRDKKPETIPDADQCELYQQKLLAEQQMIEEKCKGKKGKKKKKNSNDCDPNEICATPEITRFLNRPDVQVVKEQKTEIVRKHGMEGPERMITQMEAFYTKSPDGRVTTQWNDPNANNDGITTTTLPVNVSPGVEQWVKAEVDASARKNDHSHRFADDCPQLQTQWEKEFQEFVRSCDRPKKTKKNAAQYGMPMPPPPPPGMIPCPLPETTPIMCRVQDPNNMSGNVIQCQAVPFPMNNKQKHLQFGTEGACVGGSPYQQTWPYANNRGGGQTSPQPVGGQYPIPPPSAYSQQSGYAPIPPPPQYMQVYNEQPQQQFQTTYPPLPAEGALPYEQNSNEENQFTAPPPPPQFQQAPGGIPSPPTQYQQVSNGYSKYAPYQPIKVAEAAMDISQQEPKRSSRDSGKKADYPYMCEVRYHEPITGSIYGKLVTRQQPCRLVESSSVPPDHNPECPVMMETPFFNPSCPLPKNSQLDPRKPQTN